MVFSCFHRMIPSAWTLAYQGKAGDPALIQDSRDGEPKRIVHALEPAMLEHLHGSIRLPHMQAPRGLARLSPTKRWPHSTPRTAAGLRLDPHGRVAPRGGLELARRDLAQRSRTWSERSAKGTAGPTSTSQHVLEAFNKVATTSEGANRRVRHQALHPRRLRPGRMGSGRTS